MKTYYTSNVCIQPYCSVRLICLAYNESKARIMFDKYIDNNGYCNKEYTIKQLSEGKVKDFICIE